MDKPLDRRKASRMARCLDGGRSITEQMEDRMDS